MRLFLLGILFLLNFTSIKAQSTEAPDSLKEINAIIKSIQQQPSLSALRDTLDKRKSKRNVPYQAVCTNALQMPGRKTEVNSFQVCFNIIIRFSENTFYELNTYSFGDTIYFASIGNAYKINDSKPVYIDSVLFEKAIYLHYNYYGKQPAISQILQDLGERYIYATSCGETRTPPELRDEAEELIAAKDTATLTIWLCSMNPEKQAYGLEGLMRIGKKRVRLNAATIERMEHVAKLNYTIYSCVGCVMNTPEKFSSIASPSEIRKLKWK
jgi:hypothetical protein